MNEPYIVMVAVEIKYLHVCMHRTGLLHISYVWCIEIVTAIEMAH